MVTIIKYLFYRLYSFGKRKGQHDPMYACYFVSMLGSLNFITILCLGALLIDPSYLKIGKVAVAGVALLILYLCYRLLVEGGRSIKICKEFDSYKKSFVKLNLLLILYLVITVVAFWNVAMATRELF